MLVGHDGFMKISLLCLVFHSERAPLEALQLLKVWGLSESLLRVHTSTGLHPAQSSHRSRTICSYGGSQQPGVPKAGTCMCSNIYLGGLAHSSSIRKAGIHEWTHIMGTYVHHVNTGMGELEGCLHKFCSA